MSTEPDPTTAERAPEEGLRERVEALVVAAESRVERSLSRTFDGGTLPATVDAAALRRALTASEAAPEPEVQQARTDAVAWWTAQWTELRGVLAVVADRLDEFTYDEFASILDDEPLDHYGESFAASEAAPTAGEREDCAASHDGHPCGVCDGPATPPTAEPDAGDARRFRDPATGKVGPIHDPVCQALAHDDEDSCSCGAMDEPDAGDVEALNREAGGRLVREVWIEWAREQPNPKPSWLVPWEGLSEPDREVDRRIAERLWAARVADARREGGVAALTEAAEELPARTEGTDRVATETWQPNDRDVYSLAIEEAQSALRDCASRLARGDS